MFLECWNSFTESNVVNEVIPNGWGRNRKSASSEFSACSLDNWSSFYDLLCATTGFSLRAVLLVRNHCIGFPPLEQTVGAFTAEFATLS